MAFKVLLDANILLDFTMKRDFYEISRRIIDLAEQNEIEIFVTPAIIHILSYWLTKKYGKKTSKEIILMLLVDITVIDANHNVTLTAVYSDMEDIEDAMQYFTAIHHKVDFFITRDKDFFKHALAVLPIYSPETFLSKYY